MSTIPRRFDPVADRPKTVDRLVAVIRGELSAAELALPCRRLSGRLQVRLLQVRNAPVAAPSTSSQALRQASAPVLKAGGYGTDPAADRARDLALIESYNKRLIELKCPSYDLARELNPAAGNTLPTPSKRP